jgi:hypothetical protein
VLDSAAIGAVTAGVVWGTGRLIAVSQADVAVAQGGGGSGEQQAEGDADDDALGGKARRLRYQQLGQPERGPNGDATTEIQWKLNQPSESGGWIVQNVTADIETIDEAGNLVSQENWDYWEAWRVDPGSTVTTFAATGDPVDDTFHIPAAAAGTSGTWTISGTARFYEGLSLPDTFDVGNVPQAGILFSTSTDPHLPLANASPQVVHSYTNFW